MIKMKEQFRCFKYLAFTLPFAIVLRAKKKRTYFLETAHGGPRNVLRAARSSILNSFEDEFPLGFATSKKALQCHFSSCSLIDLTSR